MRTGAIVMMSACIPAAASHGALVAGGMYINQSASAAASAAIGSGHTVVDLIFSFDEADDRLISIEDAGFIGAANLYQDAFGADHANGINPAFFAPFPQLPYDSYVGIGGPHYQGSGFGGDVDPDFVWGATGVVAGGWFATPNGNGDFAGAGVLNDDTGLYDVFAGRFTLAADFGFREAGQRELGHRGRRFLLLNSQGLFENIDVSRGAMTVNWVDFQGAELSSRETTFVPAPGALMAFGIAGCAAARRRR